ncbi:MAG TPA: 30S ribosomal protein S20 [Candidatus Tumulicola sp.]
MPNIKAAEKWMRQSETRTIRNRDANSRLKTLFKKAVTAADAQTTATVEGAFDSAASKGIIHPNKAARKKSRLSKAITRAAAAPVKPVKAKSTKSKTGRKTAKK